MTNGDRIRSLPDAELGLWIAQRVDCSLCPVNKTCRKKDTDPESCAEVIRKWLGENLEHHAVKKAVRISPNFVNSFTGTFIDPMADPLTSRNPLGIPLEE